MKYTIIAASHQQPSNSLKVANYIKRQIEKDSTNSANLFNLKQYALPFWGPEIYKDETVMQTWRPISDALNKNDGIVVITPEYNGMATPILNNFFLYASAKELAHKAGLIVSVSSGIGGSYPITELRASSYKNCRLCYTPDHVIVRFANNVLNDSDAQDESDAITRRRIEHGLMVLAAYSKALKKMRENTVLMQDDLPNGM